MKNIVLTSSTSESPLDDKHCYVCVGPNCWGKGQTDAEAFKNAKANAPYGYKGHFITRVALTDCGVDPIDGAVMWSSDHDAKNCLFCTVGKGIRISIK